MDSEITTLDTVVRLNKTYYNMGVKIEVEKIYFPNTHTITESIVMSSAPKVPKHYFEDDYHA